LTEESGGTRKKKAAKVRKEKEGEDKVCSRDVGCGILWGKGRRKIRRRKERNNKSKKKRIRKRKEETFYRRVKKRKRPLAFSLKGKRKKSLGQSGVTKSRLYD